MCAALENRYAWVDTNDEGGAYYRNMLCRVEEDAKVPEFLFNVPFGQGTSVFSLGKQSVFLESFESETGMVQMVAEQLASCLPSDCPKECRLQLCLHTDDEIPAIRHRGADNHLTLVVTGYDPVCASDTRAMMREEELAQMEQGTIYRLQQFSDSRALVACDERSRAYRKSIAKSVLDLLQCSYDFNVPDSVMASDKDLIYDTMNFNHVHLVHESGDHFLVGTDVNMGTDACVFHTPQTGCSIFTGDAAETKTWQLPASNGRTVNVATKEAMELIVTGESSLADLVVDLDEFRTMVIDCTIAGTKKEETTATQASVDGNEYTNIDAHEHTYRNSPPISFVKGAKECTQVLSLKTLATALPVACRPNGLIASVLACTTIAELLAFTPDNTATVHIPNTAHWQQQLTEADVGGRPFHFMNERTAVCDGNNRVKNYEIDRNSFN